MVEESTGLGDDEEEGAVIGFKLEVEGRCARREARFCLAKGASGRGEEEEGGRLVTDRGVRSTEEEALWRSRSRSTICGAEACWSCMWLENVCMYVSRFVDFFLSFSSKRVSECRLIHEPVSVYQVGIACWRLVLR
jgi:hypothetical protein